MTVVLSDGRVEEDKEGDGDKVLVLVAAVVVVVVVGDEPVPVGNVSVPVLRGTVGVKKGSVMEPVIESTLVGLEVSVEGTEKLGVVVSGVSGGREVRGSETTCLGR